MEKILAKALDYLSAHIKDFKWNKQVKPQRFTCPMCLKSTPTANFIPHTDYQMWCQNCNMSIGSIVDIVRITEDEKSEWTDDEIFKYLGETYGIEVISKAETVVALEFYKNNNFDMVPIARNSKTPIEKEWTTKTHKNEKEWQEWLDQKINIGVKTGAVSGIIIIDIDQDPIPEELKKFVEIGTLSQRTRQGHHFFFKYEKDIPKTRIESLKLDIENDGGQVVIFPSIVEDTKRDIELNEIKSMSPEFKEFLLSKIGYKRNGETNNIPVSEFITKGTNIQLGEILEGNRHNVFMRLGGILRKDLNSQQTRNVLTLFNQYFCKPPLDMRDFNAITDSLEKYMDFDEKELAQKILVYLRIVEDASARDIREALGFKPTGEEKTRIDKAISFLVKELYIIKKQRQFHIIKKIDWKDTFLDEGREIDYIMPYFHDYAIFRNGDMIVIGGGQKTGKSHLALNIIKRLIQQGKKPHYLNLESGNRYAIISKQLGLAEGLFWNATHFSPDQVDLEQNAITVIDWLLPQNYAETDKLFQHFAKQLVKNGGNLIIFMQLRENGKFFASDMVAMFPAFVCRYLYTDNEEGIEGKFLIDFMREPKIKTKRGEIPCRYNRDTKEVLRLDELEERGEL